MIDTGEVMGFSLDDFGVTAVVEFTTITMAGLFSESTLNAGEDWREIELDQPSLEVAESDAGLVTNNVSVLVIDGVRYQSFRRTPAVNGSVRLLLTRDF